ncbi:Ubiquitin-associated domain [Sesbania bispinosa]|nr:Ubiquitin-associated domain [Sesbania bispinosa]
MQQLLSMGFPDELAAQALAATGGKSTVKATEWILTHKSNPSPSSSSFQPKLDRFFHSQSIEEDEPTKRLKLSPPTSRSSFFFNRSKAPDKKHTHTQEPLYERLRPRTLDDVVGQDHLLATNSLLRSAIQRNRLPSILLWGPTWHCGVKDVRDAVDEARKLRLKNNQTTVLFVDEVHRFNKSQQDSSYPSLKMETNNCDGDARVALNALEIAAVTAAARSQHVKKEKEQDTNEEECKAVVVSVTLDDAKEAFQCKHLAYDKAGEEHYNLISALHKSMRGSDANAAIYWLARMLQGGEEPLYIARRLIRFASEDVGLADPLALNQAVSCYQACHFLGMPECNVILAQCAAYLALAPKSIAVYRAIGAAEKVVRESVGQNEGVPLHLRNAPTKLMKEIGMGRGTYTLLIILPQHRPTYHPHLKATSSSIGLDKSASDG